ncbi:cc-nbs-lrr resistance protein [Corchorus olitorius]|uniref:Cc-nbs-lrr resistance protein n=1 Tax=Corchorus olitorius TaxID=93759 RepID=A0A1R3FUU4_9ROSI|nr:cc-nbs-lrr resistance protein [Corchorus olitorius]
MSFSAKHARTSFLPDGLWRNTKKKPMMIEGGMGFMDFGPEKLISRAILDAIIGTTTQPLAQVQDLQGELDKNLRGKTFIFVFDDVRTRIRDY